MARIDELLDFDSAPAAAEVDGTDYSLAAASDSFADALFDLSKTFADIDFSAESFKVTWLAVASGSPFMGIAPNGGDVTLTWDATGNLDLSVA